MARPLRIEFPGAVYHVTSRGNARQPIFNDYEDRGGFLDILSIVVERFNWLCHAYCLMENHYHLLIETPNGNLSKGMRELNGVYTQRFNQRYRQVGHLFQGRYKAILVEKDRHLLSLCRYVVLNPVRVGLIKRPDQWRWSSYGATMGMRRRPPFLTIDWILSQFGRRKRAAREAYKRFVIGETDRESPWRTLKGQIFLGTEEFIQGLRGLLEKKVEIKEVPRVQRYVARPPLRGLLRGKREREKAVEDRAIYDAYVRYGYTMKEIANHLGLHYATIGRAIKRVEGR
ncbi:MAG TPA: transposase [Thermodesulfobacteriota bacterium]|nr:transposase [Thermodesulfobacteriota bacterium]